VQSAKQVNSKSVTYVHQNLNLGKWRQNLLISSKDYKRHIFLILEKVKDWNEEEEKGTGKIRVEKERSGTYSLPASFCRFRHWALLSCSLSLQDLRRGGNQDLQSK
jgi:hypothetical protein